MPVEVGTIIIAVLSVLLARKWRRIPSVLARFLAAAVAPAVLAVLLYFVSFGSSGANDSEVRLWAPLFLGVWAVPGIIVSLIATAVLSVRRK